MRRDHLWQQFGHAWSLSCNIDLTLGGCCSLGGCRHRTGTSQSTCCMRRGRELPLDKPLSETGVTPEDPLVVVRRVLKADGAFVCHRLM